MKQSRLASLLESVGSTAFGFVLSIVLQLVFFPILGIQASLSQNVIFTVIMTVASVARQYVWRRLMEALHVRAPISPFAAAVLAERARQITGEGWDTAHDDKHERGELAAAAACYALHVALPERVGTSNGAAVYWPWDWDWWKPGDGPRRNLVKAGALIMAEGEKFDRFRKRRDYP